MIQAVTTKADRATIRRRVDEVLRLLLDGKTVPEICQDASVIGWGVGERTVRRYAARAFESLADITEKKRRQLFGQHRIRREVLYQQARASGELGVALAILKDDAELLGLYPSKTVNTNSVLSFPDPAVMKAEIMKRIGAGIN